MQSSPKEKAGPNSIDSEIDNDAFISFSKLTLRDRTGSYTETQMGDKCNSKCYKHKPIRKEDQDFKNGNKHRSTKPKKQNSGKKILQLQRKIQELEKQVNSLRRMTDSCPTCEHRYNRQALVDDASIMFQQHQISKLAGELDSRRNSKDSVQFEKIQFNQSLMHKPEMVEKSWILLGITMIAMGSKVLDVDGTISVFKLLKDSVDSIRRQVEKSQEKIKIDFYTSKEQMKDQMPMSQVGFDPFFQRNQKAGFQLEGIKFQSVERFQLFYDEKLNFSVSYESLLTAHEYLKEHAWISLG